MYIPEFKSDFTQKLREKRQGIAPLPSFGHYPSEPEGGELNPITPDERIARGVYKRYFAKFIPTKQVIEISQNSYEVTKRLPESFTSYEIFDITWDSSSPYEDRVVGGYLQRGANYANYLTLLKVLPKYPELFSIVVEDGSFDIYAETQGRGFKTRENKEYVGTLEFRANGKIYASTGERLFPIDKVITEFDK